MGILLAAVIGFTVQGEPVMAEKANDAKAGGPVNPVHSCTKQSDGTDTTTWSYVYFGSYPQSEITGGALTEAITGASYDANGDVWVTEQNTAGSVKAM